MIAGPQEVCFSGGILRRGFWLYVWEVTPPEGEVLYYVGRTGDSSSINAQSPFNRMSQHLGFARTGNMLRKYLRRHGVEPEGCEFRLVALGPLEEESKSREEHRERRDRVGAMEMALADTLTAAGCRVMNRVTSRKQLDEVRFTQVRAAFVSAFPHLVQPATAGSLKTGS